MSRLDRRAFLIRSGVAVGAGFGATSWPLRGYSAGDDVSDVVIVGGGFAGATCAKYLRRADATLSVTLIERESRYVTGPMSNAVIGGLRTLDGITLTHDALASRHGVRVIRGDVTDIDPATRRVTLADGRAYAGERLVVAPGIELDYSTLEGSDGSTSERMPHAWQPGAQTGLLRSQLESMDDGGTVVVAVPADPYRCPPGPYERAGLVAHYLTRRKPRSKVLILDAKESFAKQALFTQGWDALYPDMIEWVSGAVGGAIDGVDPDAMALIADSERHVGDVINLIPPQRAGALAAAAGLTAEDGWCPVEPATFESTRASGIHVIGDAARAGKLPKSGAAANAEGKVCAAAIAAAFAGDPPPEPSFVNACYSLLSPDYGIAVAGVFERTDAGITAVPGASGTSPLQASARYRRKEARDADGWYASIVADTFA